MSAAGCTARGPREQPCVQAYANAWYDFGYFLVVARDRAWALRAGNATLAQGQLPLTANLAAGRGGTRTGGGTHTGGEWYRLKLAVVGQSVAGWVDGSLLANVSDSSFLRGWAGIGSGFHRAHFLNFSLARHSWQQ